MRKRSKPALQGTVRRALAVTGAGLAAPLLIAATSVNIAPAQAVSTMPPAARSVSAKPPANQDRVEIACWLGLSAGTGIVISASRRRRQFTTA